MNVFIQHTCKPTETNFSATNSGTCTDWPMETEFSKLEAKHKTGQKPDFITINLHRTHTQYYKTKLMRAQFGVIEFTTVNTDVS